MSDDSMSKSSEGGNQEKLKLYIENMNYNLHRMPLDFKITSYPPECNDKKQAPELCGGVKIERSLKNVELRRGLIIQGDA